MKHDFDSISEREGTCCEKYDLRKQIFSREDIIPMWVADMDFHTAPFITEALVKRATLGEFGYGFRSEDFFTSVSRWVARRNNWHIKNSSIGFSPGVVCGIAIALRAFTKEGDKVVIQPPVYPPFARTIIANGRIVSENTLVKTQNGFEIDFSDLDAKLTDAKALILCNPHNPTGRVFTTDELKRIEALALKHNVMIISDEIHSDLIQKPCRHTHIASLGQEISKKCITFISASKTFNLAGLSTSAVIIEDEQIRERYNAEFNKLHADQGNVFGTIAMQTAYDLGDEWLDELNEYLGKNLDYAVEFINTHMPELEVFKSEGTYLLWVNFKAWNLTHSELYEHIIHKAKLGLDSGLRFGAAGENYMRINLGTSLEVIKKALNQLLESRP
ncbi:MAG: PatB family C-S lyase [Rikenellaceae bacterium]